MNYSRILTVTHSTIAKGGSDDDAARAAFTALKGSKQTLASLLKQEREHGITKRSVSASYRALVASMRAVVIGCGVEVTERKVVGRAIALSVWQDEGYAAPLVESTKTPLKGQEKKDYTNIKQRISRLARDIVGETKPMEQVAALVIPRAVRAGIKAATLDAGVDYKVALATLKAVYGK